MAEGHEPVVLELAPLPREQVGPFLLLGLDKDADPKRVEANWAQRVIWARKSQFAVPLEDVNWAREVIRDPERRIRADAASFNLDTVDGTLRGLAERYGAAEPAGPSWRPRDRKKVPEDHAPPVDAPDPEEIRAQVVLPDLAPEMPGAAWLLDQLARQPLDPWGIELPPEPEQGQPA
jgi:hypothetical protein